MSPSLLSVWVVWVVCVGDVATLIVSVGCKRGTSQRWPDLEVMEEMLGSGGPLHDLGAQGVVLYVDQDSGLSDALLALSTLRATPVVVVGLGSGPQGSKWVQGQPAAVLGGRHLVHVVVFEHDPRPFLREAAQDQRWNPEFLMLVNLGCQHAEHIVTDKIFSHIQHLILVCPLLSMVTNLTRTGIYTYLPYAETDKLRLVETGVGEVFVDRFPSFMGVTLNLGTWFDDYPYLYQSKTGDDGVGDGVAVEMLDALAGTLGYEYTLTTEPPDLQWGALENGSWTGMLGMVHRRDKNFTVNSMTLTDERMEALDASHPYWMEGFGLTLITPPPLPRWRAVYYPFHGLVWLTFVASFTLLVALMALQGGVMGDGVVAGVSEAWAYLVRPVLSHSLPRLPDPTAQWQRVFLATWILACLILTTAYTANLIAFLTIPVYPERIQTLEQLANSEFRITMSDYGDFVDGALVSSESPVYRALGKKLDLFSGYDTVIHLMATGSHAFLDLYSYNIITVAAEYKIRNVYMLREQLYPGHLCWYFQKNTAWKYKFDHGIQRLVEGGLVSHWLKKRLPSYWEEQKQRKDPPSNPSLSNTSKLLSSSSFWHPYLASLSSSLR